MRLSARILKCHGYILHKKFYYFDVGVFRSLRSVGPIDLTSEMDGLALEGLVAQHLRAWNDYQNEPNQLFYWHTRYGVEVDFIIYGKNNFCAIEIKNNAIAREQDLRGLKAFCADYPEAKPLLLYRGKDTLKMSGVDCIPVDQFLASLNPHQSHLAFP